MNICILSGNVGTVELVGSEGKSAALRISLATNEKFKNSAGEPQEVTTWHNCVVFGTRAESLAPHVRKGSRLNITGKIRTDSYEKDGVKHKNTTVVVDQLEFAGSPPKAEVSDEESSQKYSEEQPF